MDLLLAETLASDIIALSETWLNNTNKQEDLLMPGYHPPIKHDRQGGRGGGGALYIKELYAVKEQSNLKIPNLEATWAKITKT